MKDSGALGYITPNNYFTSLAGVQLREYLGLNKLVEKLLILIILKFLKLKPIPQLLLTKQRRNFSTTKG